LPGCRKTKKNRQELKQSEEIWNAIEIITNTDGYNAHEGYLKFRQQTKPVLKKGVGRRLWANPLSKIAAALIIAMGISFLTYQITISRTVAVAYFEMKTLKGTQTMLTLTDGTKVWLNGGSKLRYPDRFSKDTRTVFLEGEGYFNVKKDPKHPLLLKHQRSTLKH
jgi:ferric-dicitrate binding protein FerR (iron transport regulator)